MNRKKNMENPAGNPAGDRNGRKRRMKDLPSTERPYEKCLKYGPEALSDGELLAVLIRSGTREYTALELACQLLDRHPVYKGLTGLYRLDRSQMKTIPGIGDVKATELLCVLELSRRIAKTSRSELLDLSSPENIADCYMEEMRHLDYEIVKLLLLDGRQQLIDELVLSKGTANSAIVPVRNIFSAALKAGASFVILLHNHPSGQPDPSRQDLMMTDQVKNVGNNLDIPLLDHIIIGDNKYISLREQGFIK